MTKMGVGFRSLFSGIARGCGGILLLTACQGPGTDASAAGQPPAEPPPPTLAELRALPAAGLGPALARMDEAVGAHREDPEFWVLYAETTLALFEEGLAAGRALAHLPEDAAESYRTALALAPERRDARLGLARALRLGAQPEAAATAATQAWDAHAQRAEWSTSELLECGLAGLAWTVDRVRAGAGVPAAADVAARALEHAAARGEAQAWLPLFDLYAWQGLHEAAAEAAARGLRAGAAQETLYGRLRGLGQSQRNLHVATLEEVRRATPEDPLLLWYLGEAVFFQAQETRRASDVLKAEECLDRAEEAFVLAQSVEPAYAATCEEWRHLLRVQRGWLRRDDRRIAEAAELAASALERAPERLEASAEPDSLRLLVDAIAFDLFSAGQLADAIEFLRRVCAVHDANSDWMNNLAFFLREQGVAASAAGDPGARAIFEESWHTYSRAVELSPTDARLINDRALIAVYYLDEHHDFAEQELHRAIEVGSRRLAELGANVPETERRGLDEAVGDAWENLAYLQLVRRHRSDRVEEFLDESAKHYPFARRDGVARLREQLAALQREP
jgi:hypothetical protein